MYYNYILPLHATSVHNQTLHGALSMARSMLAPPTWLVSSHFCGHPLPCSKESNADSKRASSSLVRLDGPFVRPPLLRIFWPMWRSNSNLSMLSFVKIRPFWFMALAPLPTTLPGNRDNIGFPTKVFMLTVDNSGCERYRIPTTIFKLY